MASFSAELTVAGQTYPVRRCEFAFAQATDVWGRVQAKVRHGLLHLTLNVPDNDQLLAWAQAAHKPLAGHVTFFETSQRTARETVRFAAGQCVGYEEIFVSGDGGDGAYVCQLVITTDGLALASGGPANSFVLPAPGEHNLPPTAVVAAAVSPVIVQRLPLIVGHPPFKIKGASKGKPALDRAEFVRQLANQQAGLNQLTVAQFLANRDQYEALRQLTGSGRAPEGDAAQQEARKEALQDKVDELLNADDKLTEKQARAQAQHWLDTQAALHNPDQVAGGNAGPITDMGDARVNYSIGAQWPKRIVGIDGQVRKYAAGMTSQQLNTTLLHIELPVT